MGRGKSADASEFWRRFDEFGLKDLAIEKATGIPTSTLSSYRTGNRYPRANEAVKLANLAGTTVEYLDSGEKPVCLSPSDYAFYIKAFHHKELISDVEDANPIIVKSLVEAIHVAAEESRKIGGAENMGGEPPRAEVG